MEGGWTSIQIRINGDEIGHWKIYKNDEFRNLSKGWERYLKLQLGIKINPIVRLYLVWKGGKENCGKS